MNWFGHQWNTPQSYLALLILLPCNTKCCYQHVLELFLCAIMVILCKWKRWSQLLPCGTHWEVRNVACLCLSCHKQTKHWFFFHLLAHMQCKWLRCHISPVCSHRTMNYCSSFASQKDRHVRSLYGLIAELIT